MTATQRSNVARTVLITLLLTGLALLTVKLSGVLLIVFAAVVVATLLRAISSPLGHLGLSQTTSVLAAVVFIAAVLALAGWLFGLQIASQFDDVAKKLPSGVEQLRGYLGTLPFGERLTSMKLGNGDVAGQVLGYASTAFSAAINLILVIIGGIYLALAPHDYTQGLARLFPKAQRPAVERAIEATGRALRKFLIGQFVAMSVVGAGVGAGLWLLSVPAAAALGLLTGLANFVPTFGPFIGAVPGILLALTVSPQTAIWAAGVYLLVQQIDGNVVTPIIQKRAVEMPPALLLFSILAFGVLFGPMGVILAAPLTVACFTLATVLYAQETMDQNVPTPGE